MLTELETLRSLARGALQNLEAHRQRIDDLNVYPVPDGDTGTNLVLTLRKIVETIEHTTDGDRAAVAREISQAALKAAKGNSGVILSQIVRGGSEVLGQAEQFNSSVLRDAFRGASDAAYRAVERVGAVEGTIVTVMREMAEEVENDDHADLSPRQLLRRALTRGEDALARTPEMLDVLRHAGVVDAGGAGLVEIVRGVTFAAEGEDIPAAPVRGDAIAVEAIHQELSRYRYCTGFVLEGVGLDPDRLESALQVLGDSLLIVGDAETLKVHVHTDDPGAALSTATALGVIDEVEIANMHAQTAAREERLQHGASALPLPELETGVVAISHGPGNRRLFEGENAVVVEGGQTANPSVGEIIDAIEAMSATSVVILPNNSNAILAAEEAAKQTSKQVRIVPSRSVQAGLAAIMAYVSTNSLEENERQMLEALGGVATGELTVASRNAELDGVHVREGAYLGLVDGTVVACDDDFSDVAMSIVDLVMDGERAHLDIIRGEGAPSLDELLQAIRRRYPEVDIETHDGGQPHYPLLLVAE